MDIYSFSFWEVFRRAMNDVLASRRSNSTSSYSECSITVQHRRTLQPCHALWSRSRQQV